MAASMAGRKMCSFAKFSDPFSYLSVVLSKCSITSSISNTSGLPRSCIHNKSVAVNRITGHCTLRTHVSLQLRSLLQIAAGQSNSVLGKIDQSKLFHTSCSRQGLEEFFDDPKTYGESDVKSGRPWSVDELRLKDNVTLHKLWYVLLKEQNMLLTMEAEAERQTKYMPGSDRLSKVKRSMRNLQQVVGERNEALNELRTGHPEEHPSKMVYTPFGYLRSVKPKEHYVPMYANKRYHRKRFNYKPYVFKYMRLWMESEQQNRKQDQRRRSNQIRKLKQRFPDADVWQN